MSKHQDVAAETAEFSLVQGGPLFQLLLSTGLIKPSMDLDVRRFVAIGAITWLPLLILTALSGRAVGGCSVPFILDIGMHTRFLLCVPLLLGAEILAHRRIRITVGQFLERNIISPEDKPRFDGFIASAMRLRNSVGLELLLLAVALSGGSWLGKRYAVEQLDTWSAVTVAGQPQLTAAGYWYVFVSLTVFRFLLFRWYFRFFVWYRFLWQVSRHIPLRLNALHPDRAGGLAFLSGSMFAFQPVLLAQSVALSGIIFGKIWHEGATLPQFKMEIAVWMLLLVMLVLTPLFFFIVQLATAKRRGLREYGIVASHYVAEFQQKWIDGHTPENEALIGSGDIQSLADLGNSYEVVKETSLVPFGRATVLRLAMWTALPFAPLLLTMIPLEKLIDRALEVLF